MKRIPGAQCRNSGTGIGNLMCPAQPRHRQKDFPLFVAIHHGVAGLGRHEPVDPGNEQRRIDIRGPTLDHGECFCRLRPDDASGSRLQNTCFLERDFVHGIAEELHVIHRHRRNHRDGRGVDNIGRIEPPAKARFQQQQIRRVTGIGEERRRRRDLEERDGLAVIRRLAFLENRKQQLFADRRTVERDTFMKVNKVRGRIGMNRQAGCLCDSAHKGDGRPFAIGSCNMNSGRQAPFRVSKGFEQALCPRQPEVDQFWMERRQPLEDGVSPGQVWNHRLRHQRCRPRLSLCRNQYRKLPRHPLLSGQFQHRAIYASTGRSPGQAYL